MEITSQGPGSPSAKYVYNDGAGTEKLNRLTQAGITDGGTQYTLNYSYDPAGNLKTMDVPKGQLMYETSNQYPDKVTARYTRTPKGKLLLIYIYCPAGDYYYYYHYNAHGDVVAVTDTNGAVYRQYAYDPYGNIISVPMPKGPNTPKSPSPHDHYYFPKRFY